jgi:hypothetical protein
MGIGGFSTAWFYGQQVRMAIVSPKPPHYALSPLHATILNDRSPIASCKSIDNKRKPSKPNAHLVCGFQAMESKTLTRKTKINL